jgi:ABC-type multidrug transport system fused ATPase/permease subunit
LAILDLLGILLIGLIGALSVRGIQSQTPGNSVNSVLSILHLSNIDLIYQTMVLGILATAVLITKTLLTVYFTKRTLRFLSRQGAILSASLIGKLLMQPVSVLQSESIQSRIYAVTTGVTYIALGVIATVVSLVSEGILLIVLIVGLSIVDPFLSLFTVTVFSLLGFTIYKQMSGRAKRLGEENSLLSIQSDEKIAEVIMTYREAIVRNRLPYYVRNIKGIRLQMSEGLAELQFIPNVSKYILEIAIIVIGLSISAIQFAIYDASRAISILAVFLAAGTRIAPALMRIQQNAIQIRISLGVSQPTLELIEQLNGHKDLDYKESKLDRDFIKFNPSIIVKSVYFRHKDSKEETLNDLSFELNAGESLAIVGPSGAGKSTLVDMLLGIFEPLSGEILISGCPPKTLPALWPGGIGYVPQNVSIISANIKENIRLGFPVMKEDEEHIDRCIKLAQLSEFVKNLPEGLLTQVGDRGTRLSGGEKQRLGIARALFTNPKLLVLDEATSSLDGKTESLISDSIQNLKGYVTLVIVAHRLSTIRNVDKVLYLESGKVRAFGTLDWVRSQVREFDLQAKEMGL